VIKPPFSHSKQTITATKEQTTIAKEQRNKPVEYSLVVIINRYREHLLGSVLPNNKFIETLADFLGRWKIPTQIGASDPPSVLLAGPRGGPNKINTKRSLRRHGSVLRPILRWLPTAATVQSESSGP